MNPRDLRWDDLKVLLAIAQKGSLAGAATALQMNVSTVSRRLAGLEKALGHRLFDRTRDGVLPTASASRIVAVAERLAEETQRLSAEPSDDPMAGVVRVASSPGIAEAYVVPAAVALRLVQPNIAIEVDVTIGVKSLDRREADLAVRLMPPKLDGVVVRRVLHLRYALLAAPGYGAELGSLERWEDARWVAWTHDLPHVSAARWFDRNVRDVVPVLRVNSFDGQLVAVARGHGIAVMPAVYAHLNDLVEVKTGRALATAIAELPTDDVWLVADAVQRAVPRVGAVWDHLVTYARYSAPRSISIDGGSRSRR